MQPGKTTYNLKTDHAPIYRRHPERSVATEGSETKSKDRWTGQPTHCRPSFPVEDPSTTHSCFAANAALRMTWRETICEMLIADVQTILESISCRLQNIPVNPSKSTNKAKAIITKRQ